MALIEDYLKKDEIVWQSLFHNGQFCKEYESDTQLKPIIDFLCERVSFWYYKDIFSENPFCPLVDFTVSGGGRTVDIGDLNENDCNQIESCLNYTKHNLMLGFFHDILGVVRKNNENKFAATKYFIEYAKTLINNEKHFDLLLRPIERAFALLFYLKNQIEINNLIDFIFTDLQLSKHSKEYPIKVCLLGTINKYSQKSHKHILSYAEKLYSKHENNKEYLYYSIKLSKIIHKIYKGRNDCDNAKAWNIMHAEKCCESDNYFSYLEKELEYAIKEMDKAGEFEWTNKLRIKKKNLHEKFYKSLNIQNVEFTIPKEVAKPMEGVRNDIIEMLKKLDGLGQFYFFVKQFNAVTQKEIEKQLKQKDEFSLTEFTNQICFNDKNEIIYQSALASEKQKLEYRTYQIYELYGKNAFDLIISPFILLVKFDDKLKEILKDIIKHNELIPKNHRIIFENLSKGIREKRIRSALAELFPQFEEGLRHYIEKNGIIPVIRSGGNEVKASLGQMLNTEVFRKLIDDLIGVDLTQHINYLACKELGGDLRNKYAHEGHGDDSQFSIDEVVLFCLLIKAYCMGYNDEINNNL